MKVTAAVAALVGVALAAPVEERSLEKRQSINYVQNYNGNYANFQYNQGAGTFSCSWNNPGDFVVGLGWNPGTIRSLSLSRSIGSFTNTGLGASTSAVAIAPTRAHTTPCTAG
jgi:endo-1,4-beta-xylanase